MCISVQILAAIGQTVAEIRRFERLEAPTVSGTAKDKQKGCAS